MDANLAEIENRLWSAADELRANSRLRASEYSTPVLGLIFLRYADHKFTQVAQEIDGETATSRRVRTDLRTQYQARGAFYLPDNARFQYLLNLPESENIGQAITDAMKAIETENAQVSGVLPKTYNRLEKSTLFELLRIMERIPMDIEGDAFGKVYEYFLGNFAMSEGQRGGEFFTPPPSLNLSLRLSNPFTVVFSIPPVVPVACSSRVPSLFAITRATAGMETSAFTAWSVSPKRSDCVR